MSDEKTTEAPTPTPTRETRTEAVPRYRVDDEISKRNEAYKTRDAALAQVADLETRLKQATTGLEQLQTTTNQEIHLVNLGFKADSVRRFFRREYASAKSEMGDKAVPFNEWLDTNKDDPLYAVHFDRLTPKTDTKKNDDIIVQPKPMNEQEKLVSAIRAAVMGNPDSGATQPSDGLGRELTIEDVRRERAKNGGRLGTSSKDMIAQLRAKGLIK